jgi:hypothetical protein
VRPDAVVIRLRNNAGYAAACNVGISEAAGRGAEDVFLLNNDAVLEPGALECLTTVASTAPSTILAPMIVYADRPNIVWSAGGYVTRPLMKTHHIGQGDRRRSRDVTRVVEWASGCALYFSISTFLRVGPLDDGFFLYLEDADWCLKARRCGVATKVIPSACVRHDVSRTTRKLDVATVRYYAYRNYYRFAFRHCAWWTIPVLVGDLAWTATKILLRTMLFADYRHDANYQARTRGIVDFLCGRSGPAPAIGTAGSAAVHVVGTR